ncbi:MAG: hypothetical protein AB7O45_08195 [Alphaproteobacteria bacterium]
MHQNQLRQLADRGFVKPTWSPDGAGSSALHAGFHAITAADAAMVAFAETVATIKADAKLSAAGKADAVAAAARKALGAVERLHPAVDRLEQAHTQAAAGATLPSPFPDPGVRWTVAASVWPSLPHDRLAVEHLFLAAIDRGDDVVCEVIAAMPATLPGALPADRLAALQAQRLRVRNPAVAAHLAQLDQARSDVRKVLDHAVADLQAAGAVERDEMPIRHNPGNVRIPVEPEPA